MKMLQNSPQFGVFIASFHNKPDNVEVMPGTISLPSL